MTTRAGPLGELLQSVLTRSLPRSGKPLATSERSEPVVLVALPRVPQGEKLHELGHSSSPDTRQWRGGCHRAQA